MGRTYPYSQRFLADALFGVINREVDRAIQYWRDRGGVNTSDLDTAEHKGQARAAIINNRVCRRCDRI